jgi:hypothetical protein
MRRLRSGIAFGALGLSLFFVSLQANAAGRSSTPEIFYQPSAGGFAATADYHFFQNPYSANFSSVSLGNLKQQTSMTAYSVQGEFSLTDSWAAHVRIISESQSLSVTDQYGTAQLAASGLHDYDLWLSSLSAFGGLGLYLALGTQVGTEKHLEPALHHDGNLSSGGISVYNSLGLYAAFGGGDYFGLDLKYLMRMDRTANANTGSSLDYRLAGGNELDARLFYQIQWSDISFDVSAGYNFIDPQVAHYADGSMGTYNAYQALVWSIGLQAQLLSVFNLRAYYESSAIGQQTQPIYTIDASSQNVTGLRLRFEF